MFAVGLLGFFQGLMGGRQVIDLNAEWEFTRVPQAPNIWAGPDAVTSRQWRVVKASSEERIGEQSPATKAFDGDPKSFWHSEWSQHQAPYPHELVIDLGEIVEIAGVRILPRQTGPQNGRPRHVELSLSPAVNQWIAQPFAFTVPNASSLFESKFSAVKARYARFRFLDGYRDNEPFLAIAEIGFIRNRDLRSKTDWQSQYNIANVEMGDRRYDPTATDLDRLKALELQKATWTKATLPHSAWIRPLNQPEIWQGVAYYRRKIGGFFGRAELSLDGGIHASDVWLNGKHLASRRGGYMPLRVPLLGLRPSNNELVVRVDNTDNPLIPPGKPQADLDFMYGSGLTRNASITLTSPIFITDPIAEDIPLGGGVYVTYPTVSESAAVVRVRTHIRNSLKESASQIELRQRLLDAQGRVISSVNRTVQIEGYSSGRYTLDLNVARPHLWSPSSPYLYRLKTDLVRNGQLIDRLETKIGIRSISVSRSAGFVINGKPLLLMGTNRHQDYPWIGPALSDQANRRDAWLIKQSGHNIVRLSHYPQSPAFLEACDELGILTIPCIAGWQFINRDPRFAQRVKRDIQELIRRDRNHPSVAFWEASLNETYPVASLATEWYQAAKDEQREGALPIVGDGTKGAPWDVVYNSWKEDFSRPQDAIPDRPGYIREYGDYEFGGAYSSSRVRMGQGMDALLRETWNHVWSLNQFLPQYPWTMGVGTWEMFDHNVPWEFSVSASGLADLFRREKPSFWFYRSQATTTPYMKIASSWQPGKPTRDIVVFTNGDRADLFLNGRKIQSQISKRGDATVYGMERFFDGSNTKNLKHPPIVFRNVRFTPGELKVVASNGGKDTVNTSGKPARIQLWVDRLGYPITGNDVVFVRAALVDSAGNVCTDANQLISFRVEGASLAGESRVTTELGIASALVRTPVKLIGFKVLANSDNGLVGRLNVH